MSIAVQGLIDDRDFQRVFKKLVRNQNDFRVPLRKSMNRLQREVAINFEQEGRPKWEGLSEITIQKRRNKIKESIKILSDTGRLRRSITSRPDIRKETNTSIVVGSTVEYARKHQVGGRTPTGAKIPARPYLPSDKQLKELQPKIMKIFADWMVQ